MPTFSYSRDGQVLFIRTLSQHGVEMPLAFCAAGFIILGLATVALAEPAVGVMMMILGLACLAVLFVDTRLHIRRSATCACATRYAGSSSSAAGPSQPEPGR